MVCHLLALLREIFNIRNQESYFPLRMAGFSNRMTRGLSWHQVTTGLDYYTGFSGASSTSDGTIYVKHNT